jgi:hypothetical protein
MEDGAPSPALAPAASNLSELPPGVLVKVCSYLGLSSLHALHRSCSMGRSAVLQHVPRMSLNVTRHNAVQAGQARFARAGARPGLHVTIGSGSNRGKSAAAAGE